MARLEAKKHSDSSTASDHRVLPARFFWIYFCKGARSEVMHVEWNSFDSSQFIFSAWIFQRLIGVVYLIAFVSLGVQIRGLAGRNGIMPAAELLENASGANAWKRILLHPTLCWWSASDRFLHFLCWGGAALAILLVFGFAPVFTSVALWFFYLSLVTVCPLFLGYQWDALLLEAGFLTIFLAPWELRVAWLANEIPSPIVISLFYLLLFRLMFFSGWVKLRSGDLTWRRCTALQHHYETQPLPNRLSWHAHHLPCWFHKMSVVIMFAIELGLPLLIFAPSPWRHVAGVGIIVLMLLISATGSYGFFNLLTMVLCVPLFEDSVYRALLEFFGGVQTIPAPRSSGWSNWILAPVAALILCLTVERFIALFWPLFQWPRWLQRIFAWLRPFALVNSYGLFAVMTTRRPEIIVEGSDDGQHWRAYDFKWKPGAVNRPPRQAAPHQPRLDWQMWFAALSSVYANPWFLGFMTRLLEGRSEVLSLLRNNPFPSRPPRFVRALLFEYRFSDAAARREKGVWWDRDLLGVYCPVLTLAHRDESQRPREIQQPSPERRAEEWGDRESITH